MKYTYKTGNTLSGKLEYVDVDKGINFIMTHNASLGAREGLSAALVVSQTLQIDFSVSDGKLLFAYGYAPRESWIESSEVLSLEHITPGEVYVSEVEPTPVMVGAGYDSELKSMPLRYMQGLGHLVAGEWGSDVKLIEIATDTIIVLDNEQLVGVVLKPQIK